MRHGKSPQLLTDLPSETLCRGGGVVEIGFVLFSREAPPWTTLFQELHKTSMVHKPQITTPQVGGRNIMGQRVWLLSL